MRRWRTLRRSFHAASDRARALLVSLGVDVPSDAVFERIYPGHHQRSAGAWSWCLRSPTATSFECGSQWSLRELERHGVELGHDGSIYPKS